MKAMWKKIRKKYRYSTILLRELVRTDFKVPRFNAWLSLVGTKAIIHVYDSLRDLHKGLESWRQYRELGGRPTNRCYVVAVFYRHHKQYTKGCGW